MNGIRDILRQTRILDLGPLPAPRLASGATVAQAVRMLSRGRRGAVVTLDGDRPAGIFTERDLLRLTARHPGIDNRRTPLREVMTPDPESARRQTTLHEAIGRMTERNCRHLVVVDAQGALRGLLNTADIVQHLADQFPEETVNLPPRLNQSFERAEGA